MSISPKLREDGSGGAESPWATDLDSVAITKDANGRSGGTTTLDIDANGRIALHTDTNNTGVSGYGAGTSFADGVIRGVFRADGEANLQGTLGARKQSSNGTTVGLVLSWNVSTGDLLLLRYGTNLGTTVTSVAKTLTFDTDYECVFVFNGTAYKLLEYTKGTFPPGSDYKTPTWDIDTTNASPTTQSGKVSVGFNRFQSADVHGYWDDVLAWAYGEDADVPTVSLAPGSTLLTVSLTGVANAYDKRASLWRFLRYKAGSQPTDENDGTLVTGAGTGLGGSAIRSDGRWLDVPAAFNITGLSNGTTYYVRPFVVMADGTIVAGTSVSDTPSAGDTTPPDPPEDFSALYADPFVASRIDLSGTQPFEAGDYKINYRDDGVDPTDSADGVATTLVDWTAYASQDPIAESATGLTDGTRYRFAIWNRDAATNISDGAFAQRVAVHQIDSATFVPADGATDVQQSPYLQWDSEAGIAEDNLPIHWRVEVSTDESSEANFVAARVLDVSSMADGTAGFEFEDSPGVWVQLPATGLDPADVGKSVRYRADTLDSTGQFFWRVRPQQPGS